MERLDFLRCHAETKRREIASGSLLAKTAIQLFGFDTYRWLSIEHSIREYRILRVFARMCPLNSPCFVQFPGTGIVDGSGEPSSEWTERMTRTLKFRLLTCLAATAALGAAAQTAVAQDAAGPQATAAKNEVIIVTGTRSEGRSVTDSPVPVDVVSEEAIEEISFTDTQDVLKTLVPSFTTAASRSRTAPRSSAPPRCAACLLTRRWFL